MVFDLRYEIPGHDMSEVGFPPGSRLYPCVGGIHSGIPFEKLFNRNRFGVFISLVRLPMIDRSTAVYCTYTCTTILRFLTALDVIVRIDITDRKVDIMTNT